MGACLELLIHKLYRRSGFIIWMMVQRGVQIINSQSDAGIQYCVQEKLLNQITFHFRVCKCQ